VVDHDIDWRPQQRAIAEKLRENLSACEGSCDTSPGQDLVRSSIIPAVAYALGVTPCTRTDIKMMDGAITTAIKRAYGLPTSTGTAFTHEDTDKWGMGITLEDSGYYCVDSNLPPRLLVVCQPRKISTAIPICCYVDVPQCGFPV
jgi:hypothetical protein